MRTLSLTLVLGPLAAATRPGADLVLMVKPQFEVGRERLPRTGVVSDPQERRRAVASVLDAAASAGLVPAGIARSPLPGQDGNVEFFLPRVRQPAGAAAAPGDVPGLLGAVDYS